MLLLDGSVTKKNKMHQWVNDQFIQSIHALQEYRIVRHIIKNDSCIYAQRYSFRSSTWEEQLLQPSGCVYAESHASIHFTCDTNWDSAHLRYAMQGNGFEVSQVRMSCPPHLVIFLIATRSYSIQCFLAQQTPGRSTPKQLDPCWGVGVKATNTSCRKALPDTKTQNASHLVLPSALDFITVLVGGHWIKGH